jgi:hypothetical protein
MAEDDTIQNIIDRLEGARDRLQNAGDEQGVRDADQALGDLRGLGSNALPTARDIEDYFNERASIRVGRPKGQPGGGRKRVRSDDDLVDGFSDNS